jgi:hypothetical protein
MPELDPARLEAHRRENFRLKPRARLKSEDEALDFVSARGFVFFWPIKDVPYPSLWTAVAGDRPVASKHDDPGHVTWGWKDAMLDQRRWYYAKVLRGRATMISLETAPFFYALSENYGEPEQDYLEQYLAGQLSQPAKAIYEALLTEGPLDTVTLRKVIRMTGKASNSPFERALTELQRDFKILPVAVANTGAWRYSFVYELVHLYYPDLPEKARPIARKTAREQLILYYFRSMGVGTRADLRRLFQWKLPVIDLALDALAGRGQLVANAAVDQGQKGLFCLPELLRGAG